MRPWREKDGIVAVSLPLGIDSSLLIKSIVSLLFVFLVKTLKNESRFVPYFTFTKASFSVNFRFTKALKRGCAAAPEISERGTPIDSTEDPPNYPKFVNNSALDSAIFWLSFFDSSNSVLTLGSETINFISSLP